MKVALNRARQLGEVQSSCWLRSSSHSCWETGVGVGFARGTLQKKEVSLLRERSSARWLASTGVNVLGGEVEIVGCLNKHQASE